LNKKTPTKIPKEFLIFSQRDVEFLVVNSKPLLSLLLPPSSLLLVAGKILPLLRGINDL
jgi:hypothetical protein